MKNRGVYLLLGVLVLFGTFIYFNYNSNIDSLTGYAAAQVSGGYTYTVNSNPLIDSSDFDTFTGCLFYINGTEDTCGLSGGAGSAFPYSIEGTWNNNITSYNLSGTELAYEFSDLNSSFTGNKTFDSSVLSNNGTFCGSAGCNYAKNVSLTNRTLNTISTAVKFDGLSSFINSSFNTTALGSTTFTMSAWINMTNYTRCFNSTCFVVSQVNVSSTGFALGISNLTGNVTCINYGNMAAGTGNISYGPLTLSRWHHIACVGNETNRLSLYVDGVYRGKANYTGSPTNSTVHIGGSNYFFNSTYFNGTIDSVAIWNRSLNSSEISQMAYGRLEEYNLKNDYGNNGNKATLTLSVAGTGLDCKGARLIGNGTTAIAVDVANALSLINLTNCIFTNFSHSSGVIMSTSGDAFTGSYFINNTIENSSIAFAVYGNYIVITNNTIVNATTAAFSSSISSTLSNITYNTIRNSVTGFTFTTATSKNLTFINNSFINLTGMGINFGTGCTDCRIINNTFDNVSGYAPIRMAGAASTLINISLNIFRNINRSTNATVLINTAGQNIKIWNNNYYGDAGIQDSRTNNNGTYCVDNQGNFYSENITQAYRGNGTAGSDCGLVNLTNPESSEILINSSYLINWTKQDAARSVVYALYYTNDSGTRYYFLANASTLNYTLQINNSLREANGTYLLRMVPVVEGVNGTNDNSIAAFSVDPNDPTVSITQSSTGDMSQGSTRTVTCTSSDTMGISSLSMTLDTKSCSSTSGCSIEYTAATTGTKTASCTAVDRSTRTKSTSVSFSVTDGSGGGAGGGGGGGGSGGSGTTVEPTTEVTPAETVDVTIATGSTSLGANENVNVVINGIESSLTVTSVSVSSVTATIAGETITLNVGQSQDVDLNDDGVEDVKITLTGIIGGEAKFEINKAEARVIAEAALEQAKKEAAIEAVKKPKFNLAYLIGLAGLVLILAIVMLIHHYRHGRHIPKRKQ